MRRTGISCGTVVRMKTTIDKAGRVVIPAAVRAKVGLQPGAEIDVLVEEGSIRLVRVVPRSKLVRVGKRLVARPTADSRGACRRSTSRRSSRKSATGGLADTRVFDTSVLVAGLIDRGGVGVPAEDHDRDRRRTDPRSLTAWHCCLEFYSSSPPGSQRNSGWLPRKRAPTRRGGDSRAVRGSTTPGAGPGAFPASKSSSRLSVVRMAEPPVVCTDRTPDGDICRACHLRRRPRHDRLDGDAGRRYSSVTSPAAAADSQARRGICVASLPPLTSMSAPVM